VQQARGLWRTLTGRGRRGYRIRPSAADAQLSGDFAPPPYVPALRPAAQVPPPFIAGAILGSHVVYASEQRQLNGTAQRGVDEGVGG
jgi:hypothetical protein